MRKITKAALVAAAGFAMILGTTTAAQAASFSGRFQCNGTRTYYVVGTAYATNGSVDFFPYIGGGRYKFYTPVLGTNTYSSSRQAAQWAAGPSFSSAGGTCI